MVLLILIHGIVLILIITYYLYGWINDKLIVNNFDFPPDLGSHYILFGQGDTDIACQCTARGIFALFTGIDISKTGILCRSVSEGCFDNQDENDKLMVKYIDFFWGGYIPSGKSTGNFHALVYYDGVIYQSYRTYRNQWSNWTDSYPMVKMCLSESDRQLFEQNIDKITVKDFNRLCAPYTHPISEKAPLKGTVRYKALINPTRTYIDINVSAPKK